MGGVVTKSVPLVLLQCTFYITYALHLWKSMQNNNSICNTEWAVNSENVLCVLYRTVHCTQQFPQKINSKSSTSVCNHLHCVKLTLIHCLVITVLLWFKSKCFIYHGNVCILYRVHEYDKYVWNTYNCGMQFECDS